MCVKLGSKIGGEVRRADVARIARRRRTRRRPAEREAGARVSPRFQAFRHHALAQETSTHQERELRIRLIRGDNELDCLFAQGVDKRARDLGGDLDGPVEAKENR